MVSQTDDDRIARNLRVAFELQKAGFDMMRQNLRTRHPDETDAQIERRFRVWLRSQPLPGEAVTAVTREATGGLSS